MAEDKAAVNGEMEMDDDAAQAGESVDGAETTGDGTDGVTEGVSELASRLEQMLEMNRRLQADFDNYRKRMDRERDSIALFANETLMKGLLPVLDNFDRAVSSAPEGEANPLLDGILLVRKQLFAALEKAGLSEIQAKGTPFDPNFHEAVGFAPADGVEEDTVVEEYQKGYTLGGRLLRAAVVRVAKG